MGYSIDDILAELDAKKSGKSEPPKSKITIDDVLRGDDLSATSILADIPDTRENSDSKASYDYEDELSAAAKDDLSGESSDEPVVEVEVVSEGTQELPPIKEAGEAYKKEKFSGLYYGDRAKEKRDFDLNELTGTISDVDKVLHDTELFAKPEDKTDLFVKKEETEIQVVEIQEHVETEEEIRAREKRARESRRLMLKKERENTDPDDMLDLVNPLEVKEKVIQQVKEQDLAPVSEFAGMYAGNTQGIAGGDLKAIEPKKALTGGKITDETKDLDKNTKKIPSANADDNDVKEYKGNKVSNDTLIERLNKSLAQQRQENIKAHRTITITGGKSHSPLAAPLNIDYKNQIIAATGTLQQENPIIEAEKQQELSSAKKHKLKDFVLENDGAGEMPDDNDEDEEEFDDYDSTGQIWADLNASHKGLKVRLTLLMIATVISAFISLMNDFDLFGALGLGENLAFINVRGDVTSLMYIHLVCGIFGFVICGSVISNGISKLLRGKADCDSVCAVTSVLSVIGAVAALVDSQSFKLGHSCIYVSAALVALAFNTIGKIYMISRAKRNFKLVSGDTQKYYTQIIDNDASASMLTKIAAERMPVIAAMRKTEFLTDFLKSSYCDDDADRLSAKLVPAALIAGLVTGLLAFFNPFGSTFALDIESNPLIWAISAAAAVVSVASPISILLMINAPLERASRKLSECNAAILGYDAALEFSDINTVLLDAKALFPAGTVQVAKVKLWHKKNPAVKVNVEDAILMAASLAIHTDGVLSYSFYDMTLGNKELLQKVDGCIYEDNCGVTGWIGAKRVMMGGRQLMKTHHIDLPSEKSESKYSGGLEPVYLAVSGEIVAMFVIGMSPNKEVQNYLKRFEEEGVTVLVRTTDSIVTVDNICNLYGINPRLVRVLPHEAHDEFSECTKYTSRGSGALCGSGTFSSFARGILAAKNLVRDFVLSKSIVIGSAALGTFLALLMVILKQVNLITPTMITLYGLIMTAVMMILQKLRKY